MATAGSVLIRNSQKSVRVFTKRLQKQVQTAMKVSGVSDFDVSVWLTGDARLRALNRKYRSINKATDVLSFPFQQVIAGQRPKTIAGVKDLGEIVVSVPYVQRVAHQRGVSTSTHLTAVVTHGLCHLLGYDHHEDADWEKMTAQEHKLLAAIHAADRARARKAKR